MAALSSVQQIIIIKCNCLYYHSNSTKNVNWSEKQICLWLAFGIFPFCVFQRVGRKKNVLKMNGFRQSNNKKWFLSTFNIWMRGKMIFKSDYFIRFYEQPTPIQLINHIFIKYWWQIRSYFIFNLHKIFMKMWINWTYSN